MRTACLGPAVELALLVGDTDVMPAFAQRLGDARTGDVGVEKQPRARYFSAGE